MIDYIQQWFWRAPHSDLQAHAGPNPCWWLLSDVPQPTSYQLQEAPSLSDGPVLQRTLGSPPTQCSVKGSKRSKVDVAPSDMVMNFRCPYGCGDLTLPIFPYKAVWMCPLFPQIKGGMYLRKERKGQFSPHFLNNALKKILNRSLSAHLGFCPNKLCTLSVNMRFFFNLTSMPWFTTFPIY